MSSTPSEEELVLDPQLVDDEVREVIQPEPTNENDLEDKEQ